MTETDVLMAVNSLPLGQRVTLMGDWAAGLLEIAGMIEGATSGPWLSDDPVRDVVALQRAMISALALTDMLFMTSVEWVDPRNDPLLALQQIYSLAIRLLNSPTFQTIAGVVAITVH